MSSMNSCFYDLDLAGTDPAALIRVLTILRRRCCTITHVDFSLADARLTVGLEPPQAHAHAVGAWLANLIDVVAVRPLPVSPVPVGERRG